LKTLKKRHGSALTSALCFFIATFLKTGWVSQAWGFAPNGILKYPVFSFVVEITRQKKIHYHLP